jgi:hypothetical protein
VLEGWSQPVQMAAIGFVGVDEVAEGGGGTFFTPPRNSEYGAPGTLMSMP